MNRQRIVRIAVLATAMAIPAAAFAAVAVNGAAGGGCPMSWCASLFGCGG
ncbi:MAG: hypothetical protein KC656_15090 [Myxococcales bacterium]|nr:hypothetical protein [Myxococcales bacterium]MCA9569172.1 hypothetical protein [Myxococcales bacterium]MCB9698747.1 hypothetical protein [Alphaproteobacteria bacterium]